MCHEKYSKERFFPKWGEGQKCRKQRLHFLFWRWFTVVLKEKKMWCVSHWQRKMVSYTIFSDISKPLFSLASSPFRLLLNLLSSAVLLPPPSLLGSKALKDILRGRGVTHSETRVHLKDTQSSGWVLLSACSWGTSSDGRAACTFMYKIWGFLIKVAGWCHIYSNWILHTDSTYPIPTHPRN